MQQAMPSDADVGAGAGVGTPTRLALPARLNFGESESALKSLVHQAMHDNANNALSDALDDLEGHVDRLDTVLTKVDLATGIEVPTDPSHRGLMARFEDAANSVYELVSSSELVTPAQVRKEAVLESYRRASELANFSSMASSAPTTATTAPGVSTASTAAPCSSSATATVAFSSFAVSSATAPSSS